MVDDVGGDLGERIAALETAEDVRRLAAAYAAACDAKDLDAIRAITAPDFVVSVPGQAWSGIEEAVGFYAAAWAGSDAPSRHFMTNIATTSLTGDGAEATSYFFYVTVLGDRSQVGWGTYHDTFVRRDGRLVFSAKHIEMDLLANLDEGWGDLWAVAAGSSAGSAAGSAGKA